MSLFDEISAYVPVNEQETVDKETCLCWLKTEPKVLERESISAHFTASAWVVSPDRKQVLMIYHNIYKSWSWMGGHADGEADLFAVAMREVREESGLAELHPVTRKPISLEVLHVPGHEKRGKYVPCHLHLNLTYLFEADPAAPVRIKPDENSGVAWMDVEKLPQAVSETWMLERIYSKLTARAEQLTELPKASPNLGKP